MQTKLLLLVLVGILTGCEPNDPFKRAKATGMAINGNMYYQTKLGKCFWVDPSTNKQVYVAKKYCGKK
ncbi:hypothetical protein [Dyadobacter aurulentus]|uniref:hypothetical protein n=1 Tax=Dyadobacter sp. UC 10 TaxID=2605428 RepID=UPI0011F36FDD|nr:hypothetical protein [Dyadobacter sp. UC 10]